MFALGTHGSALSLYPGLPGLDIITKEGSFKLKPSPRSGGAVKNKEYIPLVYTDKALDAKKDVLASYGFAPGQFAFVSNEQQAGNDAATVRCLWHRLASSCPLRAPFIPCTSI